MELEEINRLVGEVDESKDKVLESSFRYSRALDGYRHRIHAGDVPGELEPVSPRELYRETRRFVASIERHEKLIERLDRADRALERVKDHRFLAEEEIGKETVDSYLADVYRECEENMKHAWEVCSRAENVREAPSPMDLKSDLKRDYDPFRENMGMVRLLEQGY